MPRLRVSAGTSFDNLVPIHVNSDVPVRIGSERFEGQVAVYMKGIDGDEWEGGRERERGKGERCGYFEERKGVTWSIQVQGRFLQPQNADDILFGNIFERPLKLPWVFGAALRFMNYIDPTLEHDLASKSKPWALSPLIATMPYMVHTPMHNLSLNSNSNLNTNSRGNGSGSGSRNWIPEFPPRKPILDDITRLGEGPPRIGMGARMGTRGKESEGEREKKRIGSILKRRTHFANADHRREIVFGPEDLLTTDFCYDFLQFSTKGGIGLRLPGGISVDLLRYWDGQPVRFVCCERATRVHGGMGIASGSSESVIGSRTGTGNGGGGVNPWGKIYWCVVIESAEDTAFGEKMVC